MASLIDSIGYGLLGSTYNDMRIASGQVSRAAQRISGSADKPLYELPPDQSPLGRVYDGILRMLPPSLAYEAKKAIDMKSYEGMKLVQGFLNKAIDSFKGAAAGQLQSLGTVGSKLSSALGLDKNSSIPDNITLYWEEDKELTDPNSGVTGYKVKAKRGRGGVSLTSRDTGSNKIAALDLENSMKFKPREESLWYIVIDRYGKGIDSSAEYYTALPEFPKFKPKFADTSEFGTSTSYGEVIDYLKWLPATNYSYDRRNLISGSSMNYGWGGEFSTVTGMTRGREFSIDLIDDRDHSFSKYAKEVINRSVNYESATITYWECLIHKITLFILDKQWRVTEKFTLLGLLVSDGISSYSPDIKSELTLKFQIVGELTDKSSRRLEELPKDSDLLNKDFDKLKMRGTLQEVPQPKLIR